MLIPLLFSSTCSSIFMCMINIVTRFPSTWIDLFSRLCFVLFLFAELARSPYILSLSFIFLRRLYVHAVIQLDAYCAYARHITHLHRIDLPLDEYIQATTHTCVSSIRSFASLSLPLVYWQWSSLSSISQKSQALRTSVLIVRVPSYPHKVNLHLLWTSGSIHHCMLIRSALTRSIAAALISLRAEQGLWA